MRDICGKFSPHLFPFHFLCNIQDQDHCAGHLPILEYRICSYLAGNPLEFLIRDHMLATQYLFHCILEAFTSVKSQNTLSGILRPCPQ